MIADVGSVLNGIWWGILYFFWNWFTLALLVVGIVVILLLSLRITVNIITWLFGLWLFRILATLFIIAMIVGMIVSGVTNGYTASEGTTPNTTVTTGCQPAEVSSFPPANPHDAITMLCAVNVSQTNKIIDDNVYDGVQLLAPDSQKMSAILPANMCIIYMQTAETSFDTDKMTIIDKSDPNNIKARTKDVVSFTNDVGFSAYGSPC